MLDLFRKNIFSKNRIAEEAIYEQVAQEMSEDMIRSGLWVKAISKSNGDQQLTNSIYIKLRAQSIIDELKVTQELEEDKIKNLLRKEIQEKNKEAEEHPKNLVQQQKTPTFKVQPPIHSSPINKDFDIGKIKSAIMRDNYEFLITLSNYRKEFKENLNELIELADLFDAPKSKSWLLDNYDK